MAKKRSTRRPKKPVPAEVFCHATAAWKAAAAVARQCNFPHPFKMPMAALEVFSIELFLKCLLELRRRRYPNTHELQKLFDLLSSRDQRSITNLFNREVAANARLTRKVDLASVFSRSSGYFNIARYPFEGRKWKKDPDGWMGNEGFIDFLWAVRKFILTLHPEFAETAQSALRNRR